MPRYEQRLWPGDPAGQTRNEREPFRYRAYVPDRIANADFPLPGPIAQAVGDAERAIDRLEHDGSGLGGLEAVARQLLRTESVASSRIEGLQLSHRRLGRMQLRQSHGSDATAESVLGNVRAMERAVALGERASSFGVEDLVDIHATLMSAAGDAGIAGSVRDRQNWLGGGTFTPRRAEFVPPPPELVDDLLADLVAFVARDDMPAVQQAAIAHAQFETIHPFADGNGRVGRCLIHVVLHRRALERRYLPPVSLVLAAAGGDYVRGLTAYRDERPHEWTLFFARTVTGAAEQAAGLAARVKELQDGWRAQVGRVRRGSAAARLIEALPRVPVLDNAAARDAVGGSDEAVRLAIGRLERAGVLTRLPAGGRASAWEAAELFDLLDAFERGVTAP